MIKALLITLLTATLAHAHGYDARTADYLRAWRIGAANQIDPIWNGLVAYWSMDSVSGNTVFDTWSTNHLTAGSGMAFGSAFGKHLDGADFDGTANGRLVAPNVSQLKPRSGDMSWSFWLNPDGGSRPDWISDRSLGPVGAQTGFYIGAGGFNQSGHTSVLIESTTGYRVLHAGSIYTSTAGWYHFAVTWQSSTQSIKIYRNGTDITSLFEFTSSGTVGDVNSPNAITVSGRPGTTDRNYKGQMDEIAIWNRALTSEEVYRIGNTNNPVFYTP